LCAPVRSLAEALADEQATINGMIMQAPGVVETVKVVGSPIHMSDAPVTIRIPPARARPAHAGSPGGSCTGARDRGRVMPILFDVKDHVARVTIDRPDVLNAIDAASERELQNIWSEIENNRDVRCVVLTGTGERAFSTGADMKGGSGASGLEYWARRAPAASAASRCARRSTCR
jgi:hypothetical protein